eukprot:m.154240 g.154240  ORF g.154240 m.154240 type:complete len:323 (-) comp9789_c0_seq1:87-1055(-)
MLRSHAWSACALAGSRSSAMFRTPGNTSLQSNPFSSHGHECRALRALMGCVCCRSRRINPGLPARVSFVLHAVDGDLAGLGAVCKPEPRQLAHDYVVLSREDHAQIASVLESPTGARFTQRELERIFASLKPCGGCIGREEFSMFLATLLSAHEARAEELFDVFDVEGRGTLTFPELVHFVGVVLRGSPPEKIPYFFKLHANSRDGLTRNSLARLLQHVRHRPGGVATRRRLDALQETDETAEMELELAAKMHGPEDPRGIQQRLLHASRMGRPAELPFDADAVLLADDIFTAMGGPRDTIQLQELLMAVENLQLDDAGMVS